ncbi:MAG: ABC-2 transporter permease [Oscillospiraceae bacterium]|nr:ABC-2 transporter permease [Oscillospiraceae bacterium]
MDLTVIRKIIKSDLTNIRGGKNSMTSLIVITAVFFLGTGFLVSPIAGLYGPFLLGVFVVPALFSNEIKYHSEKLPFILPIRRSDLVNARFLFAAGTYFIVGLVVYVLMLLSAKIKLYTLILGDEDADFLKVISERLGFSPLLFFSMIYSLAFAVGLLSLGMQLRAYFKDPARLKADLDMTSNKNSKKEKIAVVIIFFGILLFILVVTGIIPVTTVLAVILQLFSNLAHAGKGVFLTVFTLCLGFMSLTFSYTCTRLEYEEKDLG